MLLTNILAEPERVESNPTMPIRFHNHIQTALPAVGALNLHEPRRHLLQLPLEVLEAVACVLHARDFFNFAQVS